MYIMSKYFITFGGGYINYHQAVDRIVNQAEQFNVFNKCYGFKDHDLINDSLFWNEHGKFILSNPKGCGYWIWKGYLIKKIMDQINYGDIILYADSGCELNINGKEKLMEYFKLTEEHNIVAFQMVFPENEYTKMDLFNYLNISNEDRESGQIHATSFFIKKTENNMQFLTELNELYKMNNYHFVDDSKSIEPNHKNFIDNRHDQSCFSLLMKKYKQFYIKQDETWYSDWNDGMKFPILAYRNRSGISHLL